MVSSWLSQVACSSMGSQFDGCESSVRTVTVPLLGPSFLPIFLFSGTDKTCAATKMAVWVWASILLFRYLRVMLRRLHPSYKYSLWFYSRACHCFYLHYYVQCPGRNAIGETKIVDKGMKKKLRFPKLRLIWMKLCTQ